MKILITVNVRQLNTNIMKTMSVIFMMSIFFKAIQPTDETNQDGMFTDPVRLVKLQKIGRRSVSKNSSENSEKMLVVSGYF